MKWLLMIAIASLTLTLGLAACGAGEEPPTSNTTVTGAQVGETSPLASGGDIALDMEEEYLLGEPVEIVIRNNSKANYYYQSQYPACSNLHFFDDSQQSRAYPYANPARKERILSPGRFIVPGGTHCDILNEKTLKPGESVALFTWDQQMCIKDRWGCLESVPVEPGEYLIRGEFSRVAKVVGFRAKQSEDQITTVTWGFTIKLP